MTVGKGVLRLQTTEQQLSLNWEHSYNFLDNRERNSSRIIHGIGLPGGYLFFT